MFSSNIRLQRDKFSRQHFQTVSQTLILSSYLQTNKKTWLSNLLQKQNMQNEKEWQTHPFAGFFQLGGGGSSLHQPKIFSFCPPRKILLPVDSPLQWIFIPPPPPNQNSIPPINNFQVITQQKQHFQLWSLLLLHFCLNSILFGHTGHVTFDFNWCSVFTESCF